MKKSVFLYPLLMFSISLMFAFNSIAGELKDEFSSPQLNEEIWVVKQVGKASYAIKDGKLTLSSPSPTDGIILYYNGEITKAPFSFEVRVDSSGIIDSGYVTTTKTMTPPELSNTFNALRLGQFRLKPASWLVRDENIQNVVEGDVKSGMHTYRIELGSNNLKFYFDDKEVAEIPKVAETRFFCVSPDPYSSDYSGEVVVEYIKVSAPDIIAVGSLGKLASAWGQIKSR